MEIRHLQHFVALAEEGSFTRAAQRMHIVQSGLSASIKELEAELGSRLVERTTRRVALTETGRLFLEHARVTLTALEAGVTAVRSQAIALRSGTRRRRSSCPVRSATARSWQSSGRCLKRASH